MKRQRNTTQMKEQTSTTEAQINEEGIGKLSEKEFRIMREKMIKNLENKIMASGPIISLEIHRETVETVSDFIFGAPK